MKPLAIDLFCGLGGWADGALAAGYEVVGFDIEVRPYPAQLVLQDILTCHGSQFRDAVVIVASPPCQNYSYLAMPWSRSKDPENSKAAKALRNKWETEGPDNRLFDACFRIQREASEAAGRYIPMVVENVRGAQPWVGKAKANFGSYYLWGDVAMVGRRIVAGMPEFGAGMAGTSRKANPDGTDHPQGDRGEKVPGFRFDGSGGSFQTASVEAARKNSGDSWFGVAHNTKSGLDHNGRDEAIDGHCTTADGTKIGGDWFRDPACHSKHGSRSNARKAASAQIAKIPFALARYVAESFKPK